MPLLAFCRRPKHTGRALWAYCDLWLEDFWKSAAVVENQHHRTPKDQQQRDDSGTATSIERKFFSDAKCGPVPLSGSRSRLVPLERNGTYKEVYNLAFLAPNVAHSLPSPWPTFPH